MANIIYASAINSHYPRTLPREVPSGTICAWLMPQGQGAGAILREELGYRPQSPPLYAGIADGSESNPGLTTGFAASNAATITSSTDTSHSGSRSIKIVTGNVTAYEGVSAGKPAATYGLPASIGQSWRFSAWLKASGLKASVALAEENASGIWVANAALSTFVPTGDWQQTVLAGILGNSATVNVVGYVMSGTPKEAETIYTDDWTLLRTDLSDAKGAISGALWTPKPIGSALSFDGVDDSVKILGDPIGTGAITILSWVKPTSGAVTLPRIISNSETRLWIDWVAGANRFGFGRASATSIYSANGSVVNAGWQMVAVSSTAAGVTNFYINGVLTGTANQAGGTPAAGRDTYLGNLAAGTSPLGGLLGDTMVVGRVMPAGEIREWFRRGADEYGVAA